MPSRRAAKKLRAPEWQVSSFMMDRALEAVVAANQVNWTATMTFPTSPATAKTARPFISIVTCLSRSRLGN